MSNINQMLEKEMSDIKTSFFHKFTEGENRIRILSDGAVLAQHFFGKGIKPSICYGIAKGCPFHKGSDKSASIKYSCYVLDRIDNTVKLSDLPYSVIKKIGDLQLNSEWAFDSFPMPYDVTVTYKSAESPANMYSVVASPKRDSLNESTLKELDELMKTANPATLIETKKENQLIEHKKQGIWKEPTSNLTDEEKAQIKRMREPEIQLENDINPDDIPF